MLVARQGERRHPHEVIKESIGREREGLHFLRVGQPFDDDQDVGVRIRPEIPSCEGAEETHVEEAFSEARRDVLMEGRDRTANAGRNPGSAPGRDHGRENTPVRGDRPAASPAVAIQPQRPQRPPPQITRPGFDAQVLEAPK